LFLTDGGGGLNLALACLVFLSLNVGYLSAQEDSSTEAAGSEAAGEENDEESYSYAVTGEGLTVEAPLFGNPAQEITQQQMDERDDSDLWEAMSWIPGVVQSAGGSRDESAFTLRGYDATKVPVYIDGIPWIDPSRGQVDYSRFLTGDLEKIIIDKGYTPMILGPNNLGGAVVMQLAKPKKPLEISAKTSLDFDANGYSGNLETFSAGTKQKLFYAKGTFQWRDIDHWSLPATFSPLTSGTPGDGNKKGNPQGSGVRLWSDSKDLKVSAVLGWTPFDALDVWATYAYSDADKGFNPPEVDYGNYNVWAWPYIRRHTISLNGKFETERFNAHALAYFDKFDNRLLNYPWFGSKTINGEKVPAKGDVAWQGYESDTYMVSDYDDYTTGTNLDGAVNINSWNTIQAVFQFRQTNHKVYDGKDTSTAPTHNDDYNTQRMTDNMYFGAAEYSVKPIKSLALKAGLGIDVFQPYELWRLDTNKTPPTPYPYDLPANNVIPQWSVGAFYDLNEDNEISLTYAKKNRFPTIFERTSSQYSGTNKANLDLGAEQAHHFELAYKGYFFKMISLTSSVFYSLNFNRITQVPLVNDPDGMTTQYQNVGEIGFYGFEAGLEMALSKSLLIGGAFAVNEYQIINGTTSGTDTTKYLGNSPEFTANAYLVIKSLADIKAGPFKNITIIPSMQYVSSRYATDVTEQSPDVGMLAYYTLINVKASCDIAKNMSLSFAVNNLFDELYEITQYFPEAGRSFTLSLEARY